MKKLKYTPNGMKAIIKSGHKTFDNYCVSLSPSSVVGGGQVSFGIRAFNTKLNPLDNPVAPGEMQQFDLKQFKNLPNEVRLFIQENGKDEDLMLFSFYHFHHGVETVHGWIITANRDNTENKLLKMWVTGPTFKSRQVMNYVKDYVSNP